MALLNLLGTGLNVVKVSSSREHYDISYISYNVTGFHRRVFYIRETTTILCLLEASGILES